jgi:tetratricopeptide (TPR) repeat protein
MRAGCFAEPRVINLINRRFVPFFFNTSGLGQGEDHAAAVFVKGKLENQAAYLSAFEPDQPGTHLGSSALYASKDETFDFLIGLLAAHPELAKYSKEEERVLAAAEAHPNQPHSLLAAAALHEELGQYERATTFATIAKHSPSISPEQRSQCFRLLVSIARYQLQWERVANLCSDASDEGLPDLELDIAIELGYRALATSQYTEASKLLEAAIATAPTLSRRTGELRFYAGVANFFLKNEQQAEYHWCWVNEHAPDDVMARRCYIAAARKAMPYSNPELGGFSAKDLPGGSVRLIKEAYAEARANFLRLQAELESSRKADSR